MNKRSIFLTTVFCLWSGMQLSAAETDTSKQTSGQENETPANESNLMQRHKAQVEDYIELDTGTDKVDATLTHDRSGKGYGGVLILPDKGDAYLQDEVVQTLKKMLPDYGWSVMTLALDYPEKANILLNENIKTQSDVTASEQGDGGTQTTDKPVDKPAEQQTASETSNQSKTDKPAEQKTASETSNQSKKDKSAATKSGGNIERIQTAMRYFRKQSLPNYILLAHGRAGIEAVNILEKNAQFVDVFVGVGGEVDVEHLGRLPDEVMMLEILPGSHDSRHIKTRKAQMMRLGKQYEQRLIPARDKSFSGYQRPLLSTLHGWLYKQFIEKAE